MIYDTMIQEHSHEDPQGIGVKRQTGWATKYGPIAVSLVAVLPPSAHLPPASPFYGQTNVGISSGL